ncbi:DUF853 domain-containing protein [Cereibacter sphaeroides]|uniref:helicase HerA-like domain-containing protein n=1 Tax=Cereibacter sphaeroides TaxID=1063 RepID=UPI001F48F8B2|nr:helicase HerA-like domain-containing protein [Cereibacter sphaeroides]MCE6952732.1 DUF853 domain-containing protein [Cereibacter sphaeroides]
MTEDIFVGGGGEGHLAPQRLLLRHANRHGLVAGATGTGKTVTLQVLAEGLSLAGVPVFLADVKGDLAGLALPGSEAAGPHRAFVERAAKIGMDLVYRGFPVTFWDIYGQAGHPVRTTVAEMGPLLLSRLLDLSEAQEGVLTVAFRLADEEGLPLVDLRDLQAMLAFVAGNASTVSARYGLVTPASVGAIQRRLLVLESEGGALLFGEPALELADLMQVAPDGMGRIGILAADRLMQSPRLYATFLLWLMSELFEELPEVGDAEKPKLVLFFDEAHLLFDDAPKALLDKIEQVARLIRSKGVGIFFITQRPGDVPGDILAQLGNRVQHALRAFTAKDQKDLRQAAETYRPNPRFATDEAIRDVGTGEAVTSFLEPKGVPGMVERTLIRPPASQLGPISPEDRAEVMRGSPVAGKYDRLLDRDTAFERLAARTAAATGATEAAPAPDDEREFSRGQRYGGPSSRETGSSGRRSDSVAEAFAKSFARQIGSRAGREIVRGVLGTLFRRR